MLSEEEKEKIRSVKVQKILGLKDSELVQIKCPFHTEKTPSFTIYPNGSFYCFGCRACGNNALDFLIKQGYTFIDACVEVVKYY